MAEEHRVIMDPSVLELLATSMSHIAEAWQRDVNALGVATALVADRDRTITRVTDRADHLDADLSAARARIETLIERNAFLEAQVQRLRDTSLDARDSLTAIASQAEMVARDEPIDRPAAEPRPAWRDPEKNPPGEEHAAPSFMRATGARVPMNEFQRAAE